MTLAGGLPSQVTFNTALFTIGGCALVTHSIFNRYEPLNLLSLSFFLVAVPAALSTLLSAHVSAFLAVRLSFLLYHTTLLTSVALYRLSPFHPLAQYPGPIGLKLSAFNVLKVAWTGHRHRQIHELFEAYESDVVRVGPNEISIRDVNAITPVMGTSGLPKGIGYDGRSLFNKNRNVLSWRDNFIHSARRKPWLRGTGAAALKDYEPVLARRVSQLVQMIIRKSDEVVDLSDSFKFFSHDFMGDMSFGGGSELMRDGDVHGVLPTMNKAIRANMAMESLPWLAYHAQQIPGLGTKFQKFRESATERAKERIQRGATIKDLFYYLNNDDGAEANSPSLESVAAEGVLVILAGSDTVSSVLSTTLYLLMRYPNVYKTLQEEVDKFYPPGEDALDPKHYTDMCYLDAVINESMRLYPVQPSGSQRGTRETGLLAGGHYIPPHTSVRIHTWSIHRDPRNFSPYPESFWPERWLIAEDPTSYPSDLKPPLVHNLNSFMPFSFGPSNCVGKTLAMKELRMVLCHLIQQVECRFAEGYDPDLYDEQIGDYFAFLVPSLPTVITSRHPRF